MPLQHSLSIKSSGASHKFTPTEDYERRAIKAITTEAQKVSDMMGSAVLAVEKQMGYKPPIVPYPPHTFGQTVDYTLNYASNEISQAIGHANSEVCHVIDEIREEIAHHGENVEKRKRKEEKEKMKRERAENADAKKEAFRKKMADTFKREEARRVEFDEKVAKTFKINEGQRKKSEKKMADPKDALAQNITETSDNQDSPHHGLKIESRDSRTDGNVADKGNNKSEDETAMTPYVQKRNIKESLTPPTDCTLSEEHESSKCCKVESSSSSDQSLGGKLAHFFGLDKKDPKIPIESEPSDSECPFETQESKPSDGAPSAQDHEDSKTTTKGESPCLTCPCKSETPAKSSEVSSSKAHGENSNDNELQCRACPPESGNCCEPPVLAEEAKEFDDNETHCATCLHGSAVTQTCCGTSVANLKNDSKNTEQRCPSCPTEIATPNDIIVKVVFKAAEVEKDTCEIPNEIESSCAACPPEKPADDEVLQEPDTNATQGDHSGKSFTAVQPPPATQESQIFHQLKGVRGDDLSKMTFADFRPKFPYSKLFTTNVTEKGSFMVHEGPSEANIALGLIKLTWSRVSKGPRFVLGDPYLGSSAIDHPKSSSSPRAQFSTYSVEKGKRAELFFTFTFLPHPDIKRGMPSQQYTWRAVPGDNPALTVQNIELREGGKKNVDGRLVAKWKMEDERCGEHVLLYKHPLENVDDFVLDRWITALLLTSYCARKHGMGEGKSVEL